MSSDAGSAAKRSTARRMRPATAAGRQTRTHGQDVGEAVVTQHAGTLAAFRDAVRHAQEHVARVQGHLLLVQLEVVDDAQQRLRFGHAAPPTRPGADAEEADGRLQTTLRRALPSSWGHNSP